MVTNIGDIGGEQTRVMVGAGCSYAMIGQSALEGWE